MNKLQEILIALKQSWRRLALVCGIIILVSIGVYFLIRPKPLPKGGALYASDIYATNTQQPSALKNGGAVYFTGSNAAILPALNTKSASASLLSEVAYEDPSTAQYDESSNSLLVSVQYTGTSPFFSLGTIKPGVYWVINTKDSKPKVINTNLNQTISAYIHDGIVYGLTVEDNNTYNLYRYDVTNGTTKIIAKGIDTSRIVGSTKDTVIAQNPKGVVRIYNSSGEETATIDRPGAVVFDAITTNVVTINNDVSRKNYKITVYDSTGKKLKTRATPYQYLYVSAGYIFASDNKTRPANIAIYDEAKLEGKQHQLNLQKNPSQDAIIGIVMLKKSPFIFGLVGSSNTISLVSEDKDNINKIPVFQYPYFSTNTVGGTSILSSDGSADVTLQTNDLSILDQSVTDLKTACGCDTNQLSKQWQTAIIEEQYE